MIRNLLRFNGEELLASLPTPKMEYHILSAVRDCLFNTFAAALQTLLQMTNFSWNKLRLFLNSSFNRTCYWNTISVEAAGHTFTTNRTQCEETRWLLYTVVRCVQNSFKGQIITCR